MPSLWTRGLAFYRRKWFDLTPLAAFSSARVLTQLTAGGQRCLSSSGSRGRAADLVTQITYVQDSTHSPPFLASQGVSSHIQRSSLSRHSMANPDYPGKNTTETPRWKSYLWLLPSSTVTFPTARAITCRVKFWAFSGLTAILWGEFWQQPYITTSCLIIHKKHEVRSSKFKHTFKMLLCMGSSPPLTCLRGNKSHYLTSPHAEQCDQWFP